MSDAGEDQRSTHKSPSRGESANLAEEKWLMIFVVTV